MFPERALNAAAVFLSTFSTVLFASQQVGIELNVP
jgi:hypothetical protein